MAVTPKRETPDGYIRLVNPANGLPATLVPDPSRAKDDGVKADQQKYVDDLLAAGFTRA